MAHSIGIYYEPTDEFLAAYRPIDFVAVTTRDTSTDVPFENVKAEVTLNLNGGATVKTKITRAARRLVPLVVGTTEVTFWYFDFQTLCADELMSDVNSIGGYGPYTDLKSQLTFSVKFRHETYSAANYLVESAATDPSNDVYVINAAWQYHDIASLSPYYDDSAVLAKALTRCPNSIVPNPSKSFLKYYAKPINMEDSEYLSLLFIPTGAESQVDIAVTHYDKSGAPTTGASFSVDLISKGKRSIGIGPKNLDQWGHPIPAGSGYYTVLISHHAGSYYYEMYCFKIEDCPAEARLHWLNTLSDIDSVNIYTRFEKRNATAKKEFEQPLVSDNFTSHWNQRGLTALDVRSNTKLVLIQAGLNDAYTAWLAKELQPGVEVYIEETVADGTRQYVPIMIENVTDQVMYSSEESTHTITVVAKYSNEGIYQRN